MKKLKRILNKLTNATLQASIAENPAVATASGWKIDPNTGNVYQEPDENTQKLADNLAVLSATSNVLPVSQVIKGLSPVTKAAIMRGVDVVGTVDGARNLISDNGITKTKRFIDEGRYGRAAISGLGDVFDLIGIGDTARMISKLGNRAYRGYHAFNTIFPYGYDHAFEKGNKFVKSMLLEKKYKEPTWLGQEVEYFKGKDFVDPLSQQGIRMKKAREDAFAIYTGQTPRHNMYIKNADGTYSYNMDKFHKERIVLPETIVDQKRDYIGFTHGGLHDAKFIEKNIKHSSDGRSYKFGNLYIEDIWDLNPFQRSNNNLIQDHLSNFIKERFGTQSMRNRVQNFRTYMYDKGYWEHGNNTFIGKLTKWMDRPLNIYRSGYKSKLREVDGKRIPVELPKIMDNIIDALTHNGLAKTIDKKVHNIEIGNIIGGKPFIMKTNVPTVTIYDATKFPEGRTIIWSK